MFNPEQTANLLDSATKLGSTNAAIRASALSRLAFLSGGSDPFQNAATYSSSSSGPLYLGEGKHIVTTGSGDDQVYVGAANDFVNAGNGSNTLYLSEGFNVAIVGSGNNKVYGGAVSDLVSTGDGNNTLYLGEGINVAVTGLGNNLIYAGAAADVIKAGNGNNTIYAAEGDNFVWTGTGNDLIYAGAGDDVIFSGAGNDTIYASEGKNFISAGTGEDTVYAGSGADRFELTKGDGSVTIIGFGKNDSLRFADGTTPSNLSFTVQNGDTLVKAGDNLLATLKWVQFSGISIDNSSAPINLNLTPVNPSPIGSFPHDPGNSSSDALDINLTSQIKSYTDSVGSNDPDDYYRFTLQLDTDIKLSLGNTSGVNLQLFNQAGAVLQNGTDLTGSLESGTYYLRVHASTASETPYTLNLSANPLPIKIITPRGDTEVVNVTTSDLDVPMYLALANSSYAASQTKLDSFRQDLNFAGLDGRGYSVAVLDTGINLNHPFFGPDRDGNGIADRIVYQYDFADKDNDASDKDGHGSNVTSIIASQNETYRGVAPGVNIISLKVFKDDPRDPKYGSSRWVQDALQWVIKHAEEYNIASVNMSIQDDTNTNEPNGLKIVENGKGVEGVDPAGYSDELAVLAKKGVIVVAAAGNAYFKYQTQGVTYPAADLNALAVGAVWDGDNGPTTGTDRITSFSQRSTALTDIFAPGAKIYGAGPNGNVIGQSGTSQAAPFISGVAALAQQLAVQTIGRKLTFDEFRSLLVSSGDTIFDGDDEDDNVTNTNQSYKRVNVEALAKAIRGKASASLTAQYRKQFGIPSNNESLVQVGTDASGNTYTLGDDEFFAGTAPNTISVSKFDSRGNLLWTQKQTQPVGDVLNTSNLVVTASGNTYVSGDNQITKRDASGNTLWTQQVLNTNDKISSFVVLPDAQYGDFLYILGRGATETRPALSVYMGSGDLFYKSALGGFSSLGATGSGIPGVIGLGGHTTNNKTLAQSKDGSLYVTGFRPTSNIGLNSEAWIAKYNNIGDLLWETSFRMLEGDFFSYKSAGVAVDSAGSAYMIVNGEFSSNRPWLVKYDSQGKRQWQMPIAAASGKPTVDSISINSAGNVYVTGFVNVANVQDPVYGAFTNGWVASYNGAIGSQLWTQEFAAPEGDGRGYFNDVVADSYGNVYTAGQIAAVNPSRPNLPRNTDNWLVKLN